MDPLDPATLLRAAFALAAVLGLALLLARLARRGGLAGAPDRGAGRRLAVEQALALDPRRRLVLVRCDGREGLILTGPAGDAWLGWLDQRQGGQRQGGQRQGGAP